MICPHCGCDSDDKPDRDLLSPMAKAARPPGRVTGNGKAGNTRSRLRPEWTPSAPDKLYARQNGKDPDAFLVRFREHYLAAGTRWANWSLVWQKACREWQEPKTPRFAHPTVPVGLVTPAQPPRPAFVPEHPDVRDAALIISYRKNKLWVKANDVEARLAERQKRPPVFVQESDTPPRPAKPFTDIEWAEA